MMSRGLFLKSRGVTLFVGSLMFLLLFAPISKPADAQTIPSPKFLVTWKTTGSYIPSFYQGKALPTYGSRIIASLELVSQGKVINIQSQTIYWYLNDTLIGGGAGVQQVSFPPFGKPPTSMTLRIELPHYNGAYLIHSIQIPMVNSMAVIYAPYPNGQFSENPFTLKAIPYFFNILNASNLSFTWTVNDQTGTNAEDPQNAQITLPQGTQSGTSVAVSVELKNQGDSTVATAIKNLTYYSQL